MIDREVTMLRRNWQRNSWDILLAIKYINILCIYYYLYKLIIRSLHLCEENLLQPDYGNDSIEILKSSGEIREDIAYMKRHRNMLCGTPILK